MRATSHIGARKAVRDGMVKTASCKARVAQARHRMEDSIESVLTLKERRKRLEQSIIAWYSETMEFIQAMPGEYSRSATRASWILRRLGDMNE